MTTTNRCAPAAAFAARANDSTRSWSTSRNARSLPACWIVVPRQQNATWQLRAFQLRFELLELHDAIGETRVLAPEGASRNGEYA